MKQEIESLSPLIIDELEDFLYNSENKKTEIIENLSYISDRIKPFRNIDEFFHIKNKLNFYESKIYLFDVMPVLEKIKFFYSTEELLDFTNHILLNNDITLLKRKNKLKKL
jgi:hypothetical protein